MNRLPPVLSMLTIGGTAGYSPGRKMSNRKQPNAYLTQNDARQHRTASCGVARGASHAVCRTTCVARRMYGRFSVACCTSPCCVLYVACCKLHALRVASCAVRCARRVGRPRDDRLDDVHPLLVRSGAAPSPWSRRRCGRGEPGPGADAAGVSPVPAQMWQRLLSRYAAKDCSAVRPHARAPAVHRLCA